MCSGRACRLFEPSRRGQAGRESESGKPVKAVHAGESFVRSVGLGRVEGVSLFRWSFGRFLMRERGTNHWCHVK